jgi:hypothetical protein
MPHRRTSRVSVLLAAACCFVAFGAITAAFAVHLVGGGLTPVGQAGGAASDAPRAVQQPVSQEGRLVAVSPTSVTAQSVDGFARTYLVTSETNAITANGSKIGGAGTTFAVNDVVSIVGVVRDGTAVATAVADQSVSKLNGPPMDGV